MLYNTPNPHGGDVYGEPVRLDFSANVNPLGTPGPVLEAIVQALPVLYRYPDPYCRELVQAIARYQQVPREYVLCGSGAAELIYAFGQAVKPSRAAELAPTFSEYVLGLPPCQVVRYGLQKEKNFQPGRDILSWLQAQKPQVLYLCNPNNPTGSLMDTALLEEILQLCRRENIRLFLDECFLDMTSEGVSMKQFLQDFPQLVILKAFTKSYGMAGIRLGYCMTGDSALLEKMSRSVQPWNVSTLAQRAGVAALLQEEFLQKTRLLIQQERPRLQRELEGLGLWVCPSQVNFLLFQAPADLGERLRKQGIAIRNCRNYAGLGQGWYRIAVRTEAENTELLRAIARSLGGT